MSYYLGIKVEPLGEPVDGWVWCRWPENKGKEFKHWAEQIKATPWGEPYWP